MSESEADGSAAKGTTLERDVLEAARPLPPDEDVMIGDLTQDEDRLFIADILDT